MAIGAEHLLVCNLKRVFGDILQLHKGSLKGRKQQRIPDAHPITPAVESCLKFTLKEQGKISKANCLASSTITKREELLRSKQIHPISGLASVLSLSEKLRPYKGIEKLDRHI